MNFLQVPSLSHDQDQPGITGFAALMVGVLYFNQKRGFSHFESYFLVFHFKLTAILSITSEIQIFCFQNKGTICDSRTKPASFILQFCPLIQSTLPEFAYDGTVRDSVEGLAEVIA